MSVSGGANLTQTFTYDGVNRLSRAIESGGYDRTYGYDRWGNRWVSSSSGLSYVDNKEPTSSSQFNQANNRLTNATYDAAGNQLSYNGYTFEYNAAGQNTVVKTNAGAVYTTNTYDGTGARVKK